jgi:hypothetical protein
MHRLEEHLLERPELARVINNVQSLSPENIDDNNSTIILANGMSMNELDKEKSRPKDKCMCEKQISV